MKRLKLFIGICLLAATTATADVVATKVVDAHGTVERRGAGADSQWQSVNVGDMLAPGSAIRTGESSAVLLLLPDKHALRIGESTSVELKELGANRSFSFAVLKGRIWSFVNKAKKPAKYEVETPSMVLGVSGTLFSVAHDEQDGASDISVDDGEVRIRRGNTTERLQKGWQIRLLRDQVEAMRPQRHDNPTRDMWRNMRDREGWTRPAANPRLNPQTEQRVRELNRQRLELQKQRQQQLDAVRSQPAAMQRQQPQRAEPVKTSPQPVKTTAQPANLAK
jgi:hypothetical protein